MGTSLLSLAHSGARARLPGFCPRFRVLQFVLLVLLTGCLGGANVAAAVVLNEILANEPGADVSLEWIELYNNGDGPADLSRWLVIEATDTTAFPDSLTLPVGGFAVLSRQPLSSAGGESFESTWGDNSGVWGDSPEEQYLLIGAKFSLKNSGDSVKLISLAADSVERVIWTESAPDGVSLERIRPGAPADAANFGYCRDASGGTPGAANSLLPPAHDLGFVDNSVTLYLPDGHDSLRLAGQVRNFGLQTSTATELEVFFDRDFTDSLTVGDDADTVVIPALKPDSSFLFSLSYLEDAGRKSLWLRLAADDDSSNNESHFCFAVGEFFAELRVSEFLINPTDLLDCEWIELVNVVDYPVEIEEFSIGDFSSSHYFDTRLELEPGERVLLCEDLDNFIDFYGLPDCPLLQPDGWGNFLNAGDVIVVTNDFGHRSDTVAFSGCWPDNRSWERWEDSLYLESPGPLHACADSVGSTPCAINSTPPAPPENDLGFPKDGLNIIVPPETGRAVQLALLVVNYGAATQESQLQLYSDDDFDLEPQASELFDSRKLPPLAPADTLEVLLEYDFDPGHYQVICVVEGDDYESNNKISRAFSRGPRTGEMIITEFLSDPTGELESEWVECRNSSDRLIDLAGWSVGDSMRVNQITHTCLIAPGEYLLFVQDSLAFLEFYAGDCRLIQPAAWSQLNNTGDLIVLVDGFGVVSDSVCYAGGVGENRSLEFNEFQDEPGEGYWYPCTAAGGSTPGRANSVSGRFSDAVEFRLKHRVFSPFLGEELHFELNLPPATILTLEVFDLAGRKHCTIFDSRACSAGEYTYSGHSEYCGTLPVGAYIMRLKTEDEQGTTRKLGFAVAGTR